MNDRSRISKTHVIVLRRRNFGEADRILTVYTPDRGKQEIIARGIRKTTSRKAGHMEVFAHASILTAKGRTWDIVTEASTVESYRYLRQDLDQISRANYVCELLDRFTEMDDDNRPLWDLLTGMLRTLDSIAEGSDIDANLLLRWFELRLLNLTGFQPQLFNCIQCGAEIQPERNSIDLQAGGVLCPTCGPRFPAAEAVTIEVLKVMRHLQRSNWDDVSRLRLDEYLLRSVESLLQRYLVIVLERRLVSVDFIHRLRSL